MEPIRAVPTEPVEMNQAQFLAFYDATVRPLFGYLFRATGGDRDLAEDVSQEVFATALRLARHGHSEDLSIPWAITVGRNRLIDHWRHAARAQRPIRLSVVDDHGVDENDADSMLLEQVRSLPPMQRAAVALHYLDGWPVDDVARRLGKSTKATESLLSRARSTLRNSRGADDE